MGHHRIKSEVDPALSKRGAGFMCCGMCDLVYDVQLLNLCFGFTVKDVQLLKLCFGFTSAGCSTFKFVFWFHCRTPNIFQGGFEPPENPPLDPLVQIKCICPL